MTQGGGVRSETELELMLAHQDVIVHREIVLEVCRHTGQHCLAPPVDGAYKPGRPGPPACPAPPPTLLSRAILQEKEPASREMADSQMRAASIQEEPGASHAVTNPTSLNVPTLSQSSAQRPW